MTNPESKLWYIYLVMYFQESGKNLVTLEGSKATAELINEKDIKLKYSSLCAMSKTIFDYF